MFQNTLPGLVLFYGFLANYPFLMTHFYVSMMSFSFVFQTHLSKHLSSFSSALLHRYHTCSVFQNELVNRIRKPSSSLACTAFPIFVSRPWFLLEHGALRYCRLLGLHPKPIPFILSLQHHGHHQRGKLLTPPAFLLLFFSFSL